MTNKRAKRRGLTIEKLRRRPGSERYTTNFDEIVRVKSAAGATPAKKPS